MAAAATGPISPLRISSRSVLFQPKGFTLIEMMVVVAIVAGLAVAAISRLGGRNTETKAVLRELTVLSKDLHTRAKLKGAIYRIVIDLKDGESGKDQSFWVEQSDKGFLMSKDDEERTREIEAKLERDNKVPPPDKGFTMAKDVMQKPRMLPSGMSFEQVELSRLDRPVTSGKAFIHFLPQGLVDEAAIHLKGEHEAKWTIAIHPLTGKAEMISKTVSLREMKSQ